METNVSEMSVRRFNPLNDYLFYKVMGEKGDEVQLLGFINAVLGRTREKRLVSLEILENKTFSPKVIGDKGSILIINYEFMPIEGFHTCFHLREDSQRDLILSGALEIHFIDKEAIRAYEMRQLALSEITSVTNFAQRTGYEKGHAKGLKKGLAEGRAKGHVEGLAQGLVEGLEKGHADGLAKGIEQGRTNTYNEKLETARNFKKMGLTITQIAEGTGLPADVIEGL